MFDGGLRFGQDMVDEDRERMQRLAQIAGLQVSKNPRPIRKRCLFITGLRMEKAFWAPKRIVAAAEPQDPHSRDAKRRYEPLLSGVFSVHNVVEADGEGDRRCGSCPASQTSHGVKVLVYVVT